VVNAVAFSPNGRQLASASSDTRLRLWDVATGKMLRLFAGHTAAVGSVAFSPDGRTLASGGDEGAVKLWDVDTGREETTLVKHPAWVRVAGFSSDGRVLAWRSTGGTFRLTDAATGKERANLAGHTAGVNAAAFAPDGTTLVSAGQDGQVIWWETSGKRRNDWLLPGPVADVAFASDGRHIAVSNSNGTVCVLRLAAPPP
jgi:WD40 repeat protein